ncbi:arsinothricin resistance N-acetyltransferase ArsN1 family B [Lutibacter sp. TH_r2]|uniref:arsinothricin resistance N-acetyltransferase ArsN1 family B n=1 Tax=Lutibacter sp. TH_r2 TaxID=3082083 RepID=UPI0029554F45|nr:arsinothricin resistance N-acetyltransferase ArsN1 family B [Lutibacter sp. TH_r2]MDV7188200.1 arsinothricin resistance N-acetyltransferase ArsN1 family B [Lutibacter sp. TH_r2]
MIRKVKLSDASAIAEIYNFHVYNTIVTFDLIPVSASEMKETIQNVIKKYPWFVYEIDNKVVGYAYASYWKTRSAYDATVESSIYISEKAIGNGIGKQLYNHLLNELKQQKIHAVIGGISLPNKASVAIHEKFGFKKVAHFTEVGFKFNKWIDVGYWQLTL